MGVRNRRYVRDYADEIRKMHRAGKRPDEIAEATGFSAAAIRTWMTENGMYHPVRRRSKKSKVTKLTEPVYRKLAEDRRKIRRIVIRGKSYVDITDYFAGI